MNRTAITILLITILFVVNNVSLFAQEDSTANSLRDSTFLLRSKKGVLKKLGDAIWIDAPQFNMQNNSGVIKNESPFTTFKGKVINQIQVNSVSYTTPFNDTMATGKKIKRAMEEALYNSTTNKTMLKNLFFNTGDTLYPFLIADNEKFLRELAFIQDARIVATIDPSDSNGVIMNVQWKDIFPFGGSANIGSINSFNAEINHNNVLGLGDKIQINALYDLDRRPLAATGFEYIKRNFLGSFLNLTIGIDKIKPTFNSGRREEYARYIKGDLPLVSPYHSFTGGFEFGTYEANKTYNTRATYDHMYKYAYGIMDGWMGINIGAGLRVKDNLQTRLRKFISFRAVSKRFSEIPDTAIIKYNIHYSNIDAGLVAFNIFKQEYYHTNFIYGFGRNEDVPEGYSFSVVSGLTQRNTRTRPYIGIDYERDYFTDQKNYTNFNVKMGGYLHNGSLEDISFLSSVNYFTRLKKLSNPKWSKRNFVQISATQQLNTILNEPLFLRSEYGIPTFKNDNIQAATRVSCNIESVYYNTVKYYGFSFAPFMFVNSSYIKLIGEAVDKGSIYTALGLGCRTRNENLVFGTIELKAYYYPRTISNMTPLNVSLTTGLRFRYNSQLIRRPDFVQMN
ncbi:MAG: hypothetical protein RJA53_768 [Bacteroidota bacterium]|jgi:hypothetical protein